MNRKKTIIMAALVLIAAVAAPVASADAPDAKNFVAHLVGEEEVPPRDTDAVGQAVFHVSDDGASLGYKLMVANIDNVVAAHIHLAPFGANGAVVAFLAGPFPAAGGGAEGVLGEGTIAGSDLIGPLAGQSLSVLVEALQSGGTYVNVHTSDGVDPANTGPGDFPGGEIRGQIRKAGPPSLDAALAGVCRLRPQCSTDEDCDVLCGENLGRCVHSRCPIRTCKCG